MFKNKYYKQVDCVAVGYALRLALANIFMCKFESGWLCDCSYDFKPVFHRHYIDDIFALFSSFGHALRSILSNFCIGEEKKWLFNFLRC